MHCIDLALCIGLKCELLFSGFLAPELSISYTHKYI